jgi:tRNA (guanine-N7-)-methyltransferase
MELPNPKRTPTTGRIATRMLPEEQAALRQKLAAFAVTPAFLAQPGPLEVELGMGNGLALHARALAQPGRRFIGNEIYMNGLRSLAKELAAKPAPNVAIYPEDGRKLLDMLPANSVQRVLIPFPDPWPKASHHKRRLVQTSLLDAVARVLQPGGELWVVTDWPSYAFHSINLMFPHPAFQLAQTEPAAADCKPEARVGGALGPHRLMEAPTWWEKTKYQEKAETAGRVPWFILARKKG